MQDDITVTRIPNGALVIVRAYAGRPLLRRVLSVTNDAAFVCREQDYEEIIRGEKEVPLVGFPIIDVFEYRKDAFERLSGEWERGGQTSQHEWEALAY